MEKKKTKKKWREIRSAVTMMCVMAAMLSTATFAWFTMSQNATVNGLQMVAKSSGGLQISEDKTHWFSAIDVNDGVNDANENGYETLLPATLNDTTLVTRSGDTAIIPNFKTPNYQGSAVTSVSAITSANFDEYVAKTTYYLKNDSTEEVSVQIITADPVESITNASGKLGLTANGTANVAGSFVAMVSDGDADNADNMANEAVRVAFVVTPQDTETSEQNSTIVVWEPNYTSDAAANGSTYATDSDSVDAVTPTVRSDWDAGKIMTNTGNGWQVSESYESGALFTIDGSQYATVEMYVWFEGNDPQCVDQIMADGIEVQVEFAVVGGGN